MSGKLRIQNEGEIQFGQWSTSGTGPATPEAGYTTLFSQGGAIKAKDENGVISIFGSSGTSGQSGTSGESGSSGTSGESGSSGTSGESGSSGTSGQNGSSGTSGQNGSSGTSGQNGSSGASGESGSSGTSGESGSSGTSGESGSSGTSGQNGISAGRTYYFNESENSDVSGYKILSEVPTMGAVQTVSKTLTSNQQNVLVQQFITDELGFPVIPAGVQRFKLYYDITGSGVDVETYITLELADSAGTGYGSIIQSSPVRITYNDGDPYEVSIDVVFPTVNIDPTDRMIVKLYLNNLDPTSRTVEWSTENGYYSYVITSVGVVAGTSGTSGSSGISFIWKNTWSAIPGYLVNDVVEYQGSSWICISNSIAGNIPPDNPLDWSLLAQAGTNGTSGESGTNGTSGESGSSGTSGESGSSGTSGAAGSSGTSGADGAAGSSGTSGADGAAGTSGTSGESGSSGTSGTDGAAGSSGTSGANGSATINNNANDRVITGSDTPGELNGETALTFDGSQLNVNGIRIGLGAGSVASNIKIGSDGSLAANTTGTNNAVLSTAASLQANLTGTNNAIIAAGTTGALCAATGPVGNNVIGGNNFPISTSQFIGNTINGQNIGANATAGFVQGNVMMGGGIWNRGATATANVMIGNSIGSATGTNAASSNFIGVNVAFNATGATFSTSTLIGQNIMQNSSGGAATGSVILGQNAAATTHNVRFSNSFLAGNSVALAASGATFTNAVVIGSSAARNITGTTVNTANIIGHQVAQNARNASFANANLIGINVAASASGGNFDNANLIGVSVAQNASGANFSSANLIGNSVAQNATGATFTSATLIGISIAQNASGANFTNGTFIGTSIASNSPGADFQNSVFIGNDSGTNCSLDNANSFVLGVQSAKFGGQRTSVVIGSFAHQGITGTQLQNNIAIGQSAATSNNSDSNIFIGSSVAENLTGGNGKHTILGFQTARGLTGGTANTILGANITGLTGTLSNNILLADGDGNVRIQVDGATAAYVNTPLVLKKDTAANIEAIASPTGGTLMYDTTNNTVDLYNGTAWVPVSTGSVPTDYGYFAYTGSTMDINFTVKGITMASQSANGVTVASNTRVTVSKAGTYRITTNHFPGQLEQELWLRKNGSTNITGTSTQLSFNDASDYSQASWDYVGDFSANDYIEVMIGGITGSLGTPSTNRSGNPGGYITRLVVTQLS